MEQYNFQYCQKLVIFSKDKSSVLLCKRKGESDYDGVFSFPGGKMETTDGGFVEGAKREKIEELGAGFRAKAYFGYTSNVLFNKSDGSAMVLPHIYCVHESGEVELNEEYSEYKWVPIDELGAFEPKIPTIPEFVKKMRKLEEVIDESDLIEI